jgi:hypothetical protein
VSNNTRVQVAVLGPLRIKHDGVKHDGVKHDGAWCSISAPMERKVLALLLSRAGQLATTDWLIGHLWQERAPVQATNTLQTYVSHLRPMLEPDREPGQPWRILPLGSPQSNRGDLYRQKDGVDRLAGWPSQRDGSGYNTFEPVGRDTDVLRCRAQTDTGRGNMSVVTARVGDKACLHTHGNRWALLTIVALPEGPQTALTVHVVVLKPVKSP